jgi:hypothetical protein
MSMNPRFKFMLAVYLACMAAMHIFVLFSYKDFTFKGYNDFAAFYAAGTIVNEGRSSRLYDLNIQLQVEKQFAPEVKLKNVPIPYIHPPFEAWLFSPFARLKYFRAYVVWTIMQVALLVLAVFFLSPEGGRELSKTVLLAGLSIGFFPVVMALLQGQDSVLLLAVVSLSLFYVLRTRYLLSGCVLALGLFKFQLVIPIVLVFLLRRKYKFVIGFGSVSILLLLLSAGMVGWSELIRYPKYLWNLDHALGLGVTTVGNMPNIRGVLESILGSSAMVKMVPLLVFVIGIASVIFTAWIWKEDENSGALHSAAGFSLAIAFSMVMSYYVYSYEMTLLLIPVLVLGKAILNKPEFAGWPRRFFMLGFALLVLNPVAWFLILRTRQFCWYGCAVLMLFAVSLAGVMRRENHVVKPRRQQA